MSYPGSKGQAGVFQRIIGQMPPHHTYVEAFFGSGQVWNRKRPAVINVAVDKVKKLLPATSYYEPYIQQVHGCFMVWAERSLLHGGDDVEATLIYCDPPYLLSTRKGRFYYDHEMTDDDHRRLLALLQALKCRVMISGYPSELYGAALQSWRCITYLTRTRRRTVTECLWCNFPEPTELHDWRYAGKTFRQRLSFKRLGDRWNARLDAMPPLKRGYLLNAIAQRKP